MQYSEFGVRIRAQMLRKGIKGTQLSKQLGISNAYLSDILRGSRDGVKYDLGVKSREKELKKGTNYGII